MQPKQGAENAGTHLAVRSCAVLSCDEMRRDEPSGAERSRPCSTAAEPLLPPAGRALGYNAVAGIPRRPGSAAAPPISAAAGGRSRR